MTYGWRRPGAGGDRGAVLVEFALLLPLFMSLVLGIFSGGLMLSHKMSLTQAAREAARYGATVPQNQCSASCGRYPNWASLVQAIAVQRSDGELTASGTCVALVSGSGSAPVPVSSDFTTDSGGKACFADNSADAGLRVQVRTTKPDSMEWFFGSTNVTLSAQSVARYEK